MSGDVLYRVLSGFLNVFVWGGELAGSDNLPEEGPAVYVANHALALGPIAVTSSLPIRLYPWVIGDMVAWDKAAAYLDKDFVGPQLHMPTLFSMPLSRLISQASVRLLRGVECIPVWPREELLETYHVSVDYLERGRSLLIFPEDPTQPRDEQCNMSPFKKGFTRLGEMFFERTKNILRFFPLVVHPRLRQVKLLKPISFNPNNKPIHERTRLTNVLESIIHNAYLEMTLQSYAGIPLPH
ncbi:MAG TPA: hypothetical protein VHM28_05325 [Anaerolineales bacterium]|jgi:hypothetical protein|nr:hypothetical protein [Anaerolineales bacterium]